MTTLELIYKIKSHINNRLSIRGGIFNRVERAITIEYQDLTELLDIFEKQETIRCKGLHEVETSRRQELLIESLLKQLHLCNKFVDKLSDLARTDKLTKQAILNLCEEQRMASYTEEKLLHLAQLADDMEQLERIKQHFTKL